MLRSDLTLVDLQVWKPFDEDGATFIIRDDGIFDSETPSSLKLRRGIGDITNPAIQMDDLYQILSDHIVIVLIKARLVKISKKKKNLETEKLNMLISLDLSLGMLLERARATSGIILSSTDDIRIQSFDDTGDLVLFFSDDKRIIRDLGWKHGQAVKIWSA